jgi:hypothetical protein
MRRKCALAAAGVGFLILLAGCGHSEEDRRPAQDPSTHPKGDLDSTDRLRAEDSKRIEEARRRIHDLRGKLDDLQAKVDDAAKAQARSAPGQGNTAAPAQTVHHEGKGGGPTRCADGSTSGETGRATCSHHGGIAGSSAHPRH